MKGCSTAHLLVQVWDDVGRILEDDRAAALMTSIDYAKAFNKLSFQHCLKAFARKGASTPILEHLATFLSNRTMTVKIGQTKSAPRPVYGGVPQGSILGVFLFNVSTDDLEDLPAADLSDDLESTFPQERTLGRARRRIHPGNRTTIKTWRSSGMLRGSRLKLEVCR